MRKFSLKNAIDPVTKYLIQSAEEHPADHRGPVLLMYHGTPAGHPRSSDYSIGADKFTAQLDLLIRLGWHTACVRDLEQTERLPRKTVIITFDDGYQDNYSGAYVALRERKLCATWFIVSGRVGGHADWMGPATNETAMLNASQLREFASSGMEIGSHTRTHPDLTVASESCIKEEIEDSKRELEDLLGRGIENFAYPYGRLNDGVADRVRRAGYRFACGVKPGWFGSTADKYGLRRVTVFGDDSLSAFARKLVFADNAVGWSRMARYAINRAQTRFKSPRHNAR
ncbi:MAG: polysaccharide deacetylase family protein [Burkholderiales bacterium]